MYRVGLWTPTRISCTPSPSTSPASTRHGFHRRGTPDAISALPRRICRASTPSVTSRTVSLRPSASRSAIIGAGPEYGRSVGSRMRRAGVITAIVYCGVRIACERAARDVRMSEYRIRTITAGDFYGALLTKADPYRIVSVYCSASLSSSLVTGRGGIT